MFDVDDKSETSDCDLEIQPEPPSFIARIGVLLIRCYQRFISPFLGANCRFRPTCSQYTLEAITKFGLFKGSFIGFWRILRCNPFGKGGDDPIP